MKSLFEKHKYVFQIQSKVNISTSNPNQERIINKSKC